MSPAPARTTTAKASATAGESTTASTAPTRPRPAAGPPDVEEKRAQNRSDDRNRHQQDDEQVAIVERVPRCGALCRTRLRGQRLSGADDFDDPIDAGVDPLRELSLLEIRRDGFADDPSRRHVGEHAFEA